MRANERVAQYLRLYSCLFQTTVHWRNGSKPFWRADPKMYLAVELVLVYLFMFPSSRGISFCQASRGVKFSLNIALWFRTTKNPDTSIGPFIRIFAGTAHSFACSALVILLAYSAALICLPALKLAHFSSWQDRERFEIPTSGCSEL